jgi:hypothetical protein
MKRMFVRSDWTSGSRKYPTSGKLRYVQGKEVGGKLCTHVRSTSCRMVFRRSTEANQAVHGFCGICDQFAQEIIYD